MKVAHNRLEASLSSEQPAIVLIAGEEPLLVEESADLARKWARSNGYTEREVYHQDEGIEWGAMLTAANSLSLFAERKIVEIRLTKGKPDDKGEALVEYLSNPNPDTLIMLIAPKIEGAQQKAKWFKAIDNNGLVLIHKKLGSQQLSAWLATRAKSAGLTIAPDALDVIAERVEGNLLAAQQELDKLVLLHGSEPVDFDTAVQSVTDSARFDVFGFVDTVLKGDTSSALKMLDSLQHEGVSAPQLLWNLHKDIRTLAQAAFAGSKGQQPDQVLRSARVWDNKMPLYKAALNRLRGNQLHRLLELCLEAESQSKGAAPGDAWQTIRVIVFQMSKPVTPA